jgi:hypothetical protein
LAVLVQDVLVPLPESVSVATAPSSAHALPGAVSYPLLSPEPVVSAPLLAQPLYP